MEENTSLWNKKMSDLTVGDNVKAQILAPVVTTVVLAVVTTGIAALSAGVRSFKDRKSHQDEITESE